MQQTLLAGQVQPTILSNVGSIVKNWKAWCNARSETFTSLCATESGESFTHGEVVETVAGLMAVLITIGVAAWLEGGAV